MWRNKLFGIAFGLPVIMKQFGLEDKVAITIVLFLFGMVALCILLIVCVKKFQVKLAKEVLEEKGTLLM